MSKGTRASRRSIGGISPMSKSEDANRALYRAHYKGTMRGRAEARKDARRKARNEARRAHPPAPLPPRPVPFDSRKAIMAEGV
jgi:hypothetical protein